MIFKVAPVCRTEKALDLQLITIPLSRENPFKKVDPEVIRSNLHALDTLLKKVFLLKQVARVRSYNTAYQGFKGAYIVPVKVRIMPREKNFLSKQSESRKADIMRYSQEMTEEWDKPIFILSDIVCDVKGEIFLVDGARRLNARAVRNDKEILAELMVPEEYILKEFVEIIHLILKEQGKDYLIKECDDTKDLLYYDSNQITDILTDFIKKHESTDLDNIILQQDNKVLKQDILKLQEDKKDLKENILKLQERNENLKQHILKLQERSEYLKQYILKLQERNENLKQGILELKRELILNKEKMVKYLTTFGYLSYKSNNITSRIKNKLIS